MPGNAILYTPPARAGGERQMEKDYCENCQMSPENCPGVAGCTTRNLCDTCQFSYPECDAQIEGQDMSFGNGTGNDNIYRCSFYIAN